MSIQRNVFTYEAVTQETLSGILERGQKLGQVNPDTLHVITWFNAEIAAFVK